MSETELAHRDEFRSLVDKLGEVAIWFVSDPGEFEYISTGFEDIWGISPAEIKDNPRRLLDTIHPEDRERVRKEMEMPDSEVTDESYEARIVRPDGTVRWVKTRQFPIRDAEGNLSQIAGISTEITEQKRREEELAILNRVLRHDIRNDVSVVQGWGELLESHVDEDGQAQLQRIVDAANHIEELTEVAREYAQTISGAGDASIRPVSLRDTLENEIDVWCDSFREANLEIEGEIPDVDVLANEMLGSVFRNLLNNAAQHTDRDEPAIEISVETTADSVTVDVADDGPGIPDDQKEWVFGRGEKGLESSGSGMGLYLVNSLVENYGGDIRIADNSPTGTVVTVELEQAE